MLAVIELWFSVCLVTLADCETVASPEQTRTPDEVVVVAGNANNPPAEANSTRLRVAVFNIWELTASKLAVVDASGVGQHHQLRNAAAIIQQHRPDILLINEIDYDAAGANAQHFLDRYLRQPQSGQMPLDYPHLFVAPVNTGVPTGMDLNQDGKMDGPDDAFGYGAYPGQYGMALYSRYPIQRESVRTFQQFLWHRMPDALIPDGQSGRSAWYRPEQVAVLRLSSKSHWDVPIQIGNQTLHCLCSHPTPPIFDGPEDRNGRRNYDEIRLWADYLHGGAKADYLIDDQGQRGGLDQSALFVVLGDLNSDPVKSESTYGAAAAVQITKHPRIQDPLPTSPGGIGTQTAGEPLFLERRTCNYGRIDFVLPAKELDVLASGVYWPAVGEPGAELVADRANSSDHRLVWVDLKLPLPQPANALQELLPNSK